MSYLFYRCPSAFSKRTPTNWVHVVPVTFPHIRFHDLRHTHATLLLKAGIHPKIVQERLGHSSINVTLDTYSHVLPNLQEAVLKNIGDSITGESISTEEPTLLD